MFHKLLLLVSIVVPVVALAGSDKEGDANVLHAQEQYRDGKILSHRAAEAWEGKVVNCVMINAVSGTNNGGPSGSYIAKAAVKATSFDLMIGEGGDAKPLASFPFTNGFVGAQDYTIDDNGWPYCSMRTSVYLRQVSADKLIAEGNRMGIYQQAGHSSCAGYSNSASSSISVPGKEAFLYAVCEALQP